MARNFPELAFGMEPDQTTIGGPKRSFTLIVKHLRFVLIQVPNPELTRAFVGDVSAVWGKACMHDVRKRE